MAPDFLIVDEPVDADVHIVAVRGEVDLFTAPEFKQRIAAPIDEGKSRIVIDLTETTFIDSSTLGVLIAAHKRLRNREGRMAVACDVRTIVNTFSVTGLDGVFTILSSREEALEAVRAEPGDGPEDS